MATRSSYPTSPIPFLSSIYSFSVMGPFEITWFSSLSTFAQLVYEFEPLKPPAGPKDLLIPITANGRGVHLLPEFVDTISTISRFATKFELALKKPVTVLGSDSCTLWNPRTVRGKKPELYEALRGMAKHVPLGIIGRWP